LESLLDFGRLGVEEGGESLEVGWKSLVVLFMARVASFEYRAVIVFVYFCYEVRLTFDNV
jgi:hypothetical protein